MTTPLLPTLSVAPDPGADAEVSAPQMLRRARRLLWLSLLPLLLLVLLLAALQAFAEWHRVIDSAASEARAQRYAFETVARDADHHVADLRRWMQQEFLVGDGGPDPAIADALQRRRSGDGRPDGYTLDALPALLRGGMAQFLWLQDKDGTAPPAATLRRAQALSAVFEVAHQRNPDLVWSYFYGWPDRHVVLFPWVPSRTVAEDVGGADMSSTVAYWYEHELVKGAMPEANPARQPYWTAPYLDSGGQGLLVSHAAPVIVTDEVRGVVGTDIRLSVLEGLLERLPHGPWEAWVIDVRGHVLADRQQPLGAAPAAPAKPASAAAVPLLAQRLPAVLDGATLARAAASKGYAVPVAGMWLVAVGVAGTPWTVVLATTDRALLAATLPHVLPYTVIALALLLAWLLGQALLRQRVVTPLIGVFDYLQHLSADAATPEPQLGPRWQPWVRTVTHTFAQMRSAAQRERRAEALKSAIVDHAQAAVVVADAADRIVEFNAAAEAMYGWSREAVVGRRLGELAPERHRADYDAATRRMRAGDPERLMGRRLNRVALRADGSEFPVEIVVWLSEVDGIEYFTASITDQTAVEAAAEVIARQRDALRQSEKLTAMGGLLAGVAHELNNPLSIVMGRASLLEEKTGGTALQADAQRIRAAAERCGRIVRTFLNMARSKPAERAAVPLNDLARAAADMLGYTLRSHDIDIELQLAARLPVVMADPDQLGQVVLNLLVNAQQALAAHQGPRRIRVQTGCDEDAFSGASVWLCVTDSGPGVAAAAREKIFDPFFTTKAEGAGTGLGLSVSRSILREHGGELCLLPTAPGQGAAFRLSLPLRAAPAALPVAAAAGGVAAPAPRASGRVLVVDDEPEIAELLRSMLQGAGFDTVSAGSGAAALQALDEAAAAAPFGAIVSDLRMPDVDGAALWRAVRERHPMLAARMVFVTGDTLSDGARQFLAETGCATLDKPFSAADVVALVRAALAAESLHA